MIRREDHRAMTYELFISRIFCLIFFGLWLTTGTWNHGKQNHKWGREGTTVLPVPGTWVCLLLHSFTQYLFSVCGVPGTVWGMENTKSNKAWSDPRRSLHISFLLSLGLCSSNLWETYFCGTSKVPFWFGQPVSRYYPHVDFSNIFLRITSASGT